MLTVGLFSVAYGFSNTQTTANCECNQTGVCVCKTNCTCASCEVK